MELVLESKLIENIDQANSNYYSVYSLSTNRNDNVNSSNSQPTKEDTLSQFLDQNATINKDFSLSLISNNLPVTNESKLRENLAKKIEKGTFYASQAGNISSFNLGFIKEENEELTSICYHNYYRQNNNPNNQYLVCFILIDGTNNLDLFRNELDFYFKNFLKFFFDESDMVLTVTNKLDTLLTNWFSNSIGYIYRSIELLKEKNIAVFIEEAFSCGSIGFDENIEKQDESDLNFFFESFDCTQLIMTSNLDSEKNLEKNIQDNQNKIIKLSVKYDEAIKSELVLSKNNNSVFSSECASGILEIFNEKKNLFSIKQSIENYKLKLIQDLNTFNRFLRKGKGHYYDLFKAVLHLRYSTNSDILIKIYKNCENKESSMIKVFDAVVEFYNDLYDEVGILKIVEPIVQNQKDKERSERILNRFKEKFSV